MPTKQEAKTVRGIVDLIVAGVINMFAQPVYAEHPAAFGGEGVIYTFTMKRINGTEESLALYKGKVLMLVNVASKCGYTPQYKDLEALYRKYKSRGFEILAFPANNFGSQEPGSDEQILEFCKTNYDVTFPLFSKISVKGDDQHPLYRYITRDSPIPGEIRWNFQKYLVDRKGNLVAMFPSRIKPTDEELVKLIEKLLAEER
jgi:glutathione peroxidase